MPSSVSDVEFSTGLTRGSDKDTHTGSILPDHYHFTGSSVAIVQFLGTTLVFSFPRVREPVGLTCPNSTNWILHSKSTYQSRVVNTRDKRVWYFLLVSYLFCTSMHNFPQPFQVRYVCDMQMSELFWGWLTDKSTQMLELEWVTINKSECISYSLRLGGSLYTYIIDCYGKK